MYKIQVSPVDPKRVQAVEVETGEVIVEQTFGPDGHRATKVGAMANVRALVALYREDLEGLPSEV